MLIILLCHFLLEHMKIKIRIALGVSVCVFACICAHFASCCIYLVLHHCVFSVSSLFHSICHCGRCFESLQLFSQFLTFLFPFQCPYSHDLVFIVFFLLQMKTCLCVYGSNPSACPRAHQPVCEV